MKKDPNQSIDVDTERRHIFHDPQQGMSTKGQGLEGNHAAVGIKSK